MFSSKIRLKAWLKAASEQSFASEVKELSCRGISRDMATTT